MFPYVKEKVVLVRGYEAYGIYDLNCGQFHRINLEAGELLETLDGTQAQSRFDQDSQLFFQQAQKMGILCYQSFPAKRIRTELSRVLRPVRPVRFAWIELTSKCNQLCAHCFLGADLNRFPHVPKEKIFEVIDTLDQIGTRQIILSGGEPTMHPHFAEILDRVAQGKFRISLLSNASHSKFSSLIPIFAKYGVTVKVPLLGWQESHEKMSGIKGSFARTISNIEAMIQASVRIELGTTVTGLNAADIPKIRAFANQHQLPLEVSPVYGVGFANKNKAEVMSLDQKQIIEICRRDKEMTNMTPRQYPPSEREQYAFDPSDYDAVNLKDYLTEHFECGQKIIAILASGEVTPCLMLRGTEHSLGSVEELPLADILSRKSKRAQYFDEQMSLNGIPGCSGCEARFVCKAGACPASTFAVKGTIRAKNPMYDRCYYQSRHSN